MRTGLSAGSTLLPVSERTIGSARAHPLAVLRTTQASSGVGVGGSPVAVGVGDGVHVAVSVGRGVLVGNGVFDGVRVGVLVAVSSGAWVGFDSGRTCRLPDASSTTTPTTRQP